MSSHSKQFHSRIEDVSSVRIDAFGKRELTGRQKHVWAVGFFVFLIILWEVLSLVVGNNFMLPGPVAVIRSLVTNAQVIFTVHLPATMEVVLIGGVLSILLGALFAILMDIFPVFQRALYPILTVTQTIPVMCVAPVFILWLGYTVQMRVLVVILVNFFPVTINLYDGLNSTAADKMELMETFGASRLQKFFLLRLPTSLPYLFSALHVSVPWAVVGAAVSEWLGAQYGLGTYSRYCMMKLDAAGLLAPLLVLTAVALLLDRVLTLVERRVVRWT